MDTFLLFGLIGFSCLILGVLGYTATTNKIIKDQEREIDILKTDNERLRSAIRGAAYVNKITLSKDPVKAPSATVKIINAESKDDLFKEW